MYLNWYSFNAHCGHEDLWTVAISADNKDAIIKCLSDIKKFNKDKDVIYTCNALDSNANLYNNTEWIFAYTSRSIRNNVNRIIAANGYLRGYADVLGPAECPFINNGELI